MLDDGSGQARGELPWPRLAPGTEVAGFIIEGLLAAGSFGTVYRAKRGGRPFAIKLVLIDPRGDREVDALRRMRHPNAVCFHGYGFWPDEKPRFLVLALELVEGRPLDIWAEEENPSALELVIQVLLPLALTLAEVHAAGVVHRDIKEANIVVREADGQPVLVDFGAADYEGARRLTMRLPPGTPEYRSPEALRFAREWEGEPYPSGPGDDLWAMGVVTYWLLTRTLPFGDRNSSGMVHTILHETPPAPHELNPRVPPALGELCMRMLEKEPEARYADAKALAEALSTEWARADRSWRVPLFPEGSRDKRPAPAAPAPARQAPGRWPVAGLVLATVLAGLSAQRPELPPPSPPQQASPRQELAPAGLTGEVVRGAPPEESPTPAPVASATNNEDPEMTKSKTTRALIAASCVAGSAGCVSSPQERQPPKPAECPPGSDAGHRLIDIVAPNMIQIYIRPFNDYTTYPEVFLSEGEVTAEIIGKRGELPSRSPLYGELFFAKGHVYGRFTRTRLPNGDIVPICMELVTTQGRGIVMNPGSTSRKALVNNTLSVKRVMTFE
ncbi:serine/threonine-protein kinase [Archangium sp.]|uniref:serine/threonine protein kinase n=1 Tax=Archangium sp. TaxID=1872627 RepID=UPI002D28AB02|nr:serine/threonine-protein kinase [Archangium sp.]HYO59655.1 serine/threonine-protein kinase [Archangium sp.]